MAQTVPQGAAHFTQHQCALLTAAPASRLVAAPRAVCWCVLDAGYIDDSLKVVRAMRESIEFEASGVLRLHNLLAASLRAPPIGLP